LVSSELILLQEFGITVVTVLYLVKSEILKEHLLEIQKNRDLIMIFVVYIFYIMRTSQMNETNEKEIKLDRFDRQK
jgi:hypothetical protein